MSHLLLLAYFPCLPGAGLPSLPQGLPHLDLEHFPPSFGLISKSYSPFLGLPWIWIAVVLSALVSGLLLLLFLYRLAASLHLPLFL